MKVCRINKNHTIVFHEKNKWLVSYDCNIARVEFDVFRSVYLDKTYWDYSVTTGKYRNMFLGETKAETQKKIDSGIYKLEDLNK